MPIRLLPLPALRLSPFLAATALALASAASQADEQVVKLNFAWPDGLRANVKQVWSKTLTTNGKSAPTATLTNTYVMATSKLQDQVLIATEQMSLSTDTSDPKLSAMLDIITPAARPSYLVSTEGDFLDVHEIEAFRQNLGSALDSLRKDKPKSDQERQIFDSLAKPLLRAFAANEWNMLVGSLTGGELEVGEVYETRDESALPIPPNPKIDLVSRFSLGKPFPCKRGDVMRECVEIKVITTPDPDSITNAVESIAVRFSPKANKEILALPKAVVMETNFTLITEPDGLIPHQYTLHKNLTITLGQGDKTQTVNNVQESSVVYTYP